MPDLTLDRHLTVIQDRGLSLRDHAAMAGLGAPVPTCPEWSVLDLVAHQGMVHRWASATLRGDRDHDTAASHAEGTNSADPLSWYVAGLHDLIATIEATPDDVEAMVFLKNAPAPRPFWARREAHETLMHSTDALSARLGRIPMAAEVDIAPDVADDGIDELLTGFVPRRRSRLRSDIPIVMAVNAIDTGDSWTVRVTAEPPQVTRDASSAPDVTFSGSAAQLYLGLWNRGDEITFEGDTAAADLWRSTAQIHWT